MRRALAAAVLLALAAGPARAAKKPAPCVPGGSGEMVEIPEGTRLYSKPDHAGDSLAMVDADLTLPVRARCGDWVEVVYDGLRGYVLPGDAYIPPLDIGVTASVGVTADSFEERLADARTAMKGLAREAPLGPWTTLTDVPAKDLEPLVRVAAHLAEGFTRRFGLKVDPPGEQAVVLFTNLNHYRAFLAVTGHPGAMQTRVAAVDVSPRSHVEGGIVASSLRDGPKLARIHLVHELTHLLQRRAFPGPLPRWLSEGMAEDLAWCRVDENGRLQLGSIQGLFFMKEGWTRLDVDSQGPSAALAEYVRMLRDAPLDHGSVRKPTTLADILAPTQAFLGPVQRGFLRGVSRRVVTAAGLFVRFLLDGDPRAKRFRSFLASVSSGGSSDPQALFRALETEPAPLERAFDDWVLFNLAATR